MFSPFAGEPGAEHALAPDASPASPVSLTDLSASATGAQDERMATNVGIITLMVTDLVGSTVQLDLLGDDTAEQLRRAHFRLLRDAVVGHGGEVVKNRGDGIMVAFASAANAVACAVAIQQAVHRQNRRQEVQLAVRIGLNVGEPIRDEDDYFGKPVVIAVRLCDTAEGGQIVASDVVHGLLSIRGTCEFRDLGPRRLKGLAEPLPAWELVWAPTEAPPVALPPLLAADERTAFVGRCEDLTRLRQGWERAVAGHRRMLSVVGEPGIGKTRLAAEFARTVHAEGATVLLGRSAEESLTPYQPFVEALQHYVTVCPLHELRSQVGRGGAELSRLVPELLGRVFELAAPLGGDPEGQRYRLFEAVTSLLTNASANAPILVVLEDLQWADQPTLLLLKHLMRGQGPARLLILGTYREMDVTRAHPLSDALADLRRSQLFDRLVLEGLGEADVDALVRSLAGNDVPAPFARAMYLKTEGNPFFIEEMMRHLAESGVRDRHGEWSSVMQPSEIGVSEGVKQVIGQRLARLSDSCNQVLRIAAVVGREFDTSILERVGDRSGEDLLTVLEEAVAAALVTEVPHAVDRYSFAHTLIRETLYSDLTAARRVRLHGQVGQAIEQMCAGDVEERLPELAYHSFEAALGGVDKAIDYAMRAGARAMRLLAYEEAVSYYERALQGTDLKQPPDEGRRCELLLALGDALWSTGATHTATQAFMRAADIARRVGARESFARAALGAGGRASGLQIGILDETLVGLLEEGLEGLQDADTPLRARIMARLAEALTFSKARERRLSLARQAISMARRHGDPRGLAEVLRHAHWALWVPDNVEERLAIATEMVQVAETVGATELALNGRAWRLVDLMEIGNIPEVDNELHAYARRAEELRQPVYLYVTHLRRTMRLLLDGRFAEAERLAGHTLALGQQAQVSTADQVFGAQMFAIRTEQGRLGELEAPVQAIVAQYPNVPAWRAALAFLYLESDRPVETRRELDLLAANDFNDLPRDLTWNVALTHLSAVCNYLADARCAALLYPLLEPSAHRCVVAAGTATLGSASRPLGLLAATLGRWEDAAHHFEVALEMNGRIGSRPWVAHTQHSYAAMLLARGASRDRERARALLSHALETAEELGMPALSARAAALKLRLAS